MICKWCGASLTPSERSCRRCGKEVSPLSDCGGFYNLVPGAKTILVQDPPASHGPATPPIENFRPTGHNGSHSGAMGGSRGIPSQGHGPQPVASRPQRSSIWPVLAAFSMFLALVMLVVMLLHCKQHKAEIRRLKEKLRETSSDTYPDSKIPFDEDGISSTVDTTPHQTTTVEDTTAPEQTTTTADTTAPEQTTPAADPTAPEQTTTAADTASDAVPQ